MGKIIRKGKKILMPFLLCEHIYFCWIKFFFVQCWPKTLVPRSLYVDVCAGIGIGFTNIVERTTRASQELTRHEIEEGEDWQSFGSGFIDSGSGSTILDWIPIRIRFRIRILDLMTKDWEKITAEKNLVFFWSKIAIYLSLGLHKGHPSYRRSLLPSKENIQHFKTWN